MESVASRMRKPLNQASVLLTVLVLLVGFLLAQCISGPSHPTVSAERLPPLLNSERIQRTFGSYGIDVLESNDTLRISNLYSTHGARKVCRTFAVVSYPKQVDPRLLSEHQRIVEGQSIGAVFKDNGWAIEKQHMYLGTIPVRPGVQRVKALMGTLHAAELAVHMYLLVVTRSGFSAAYATITEVHHPDYLTVDYLKAIYGQDAAVHTNPDDDVGQVLNIVYQKLRK